MYVKVMPPPPPPHPHNTIIFLTVTQNEDLLWFTLRSQPL